MTNNTFLIILGNIFDMTFPGNVFAVKMVWVGTRVLFHDLTYLGFAFFNSAPVKAKFRSESQIQTRGHRFTQVTQPFFSLWFYLSEQLT